MEVDGDAPPHAASSSSSSAAAAAAAAAPAVPLHVTEPRKNFVYYHTHVAFYFWLYLIARDNEMLNVEQAMPWLVLYARLNVLGVVSPGTKVRAWARKPATLATLMTMRAEYCRLEYDVDDAADIYLQTYDENYGGSPYAVLPVDDVADVEEGGGGEAGGGEAGGGGGGGGGAKPKKAARKRGAAGAAAAGAAAVLSPAQKIVSALLQSPSPAALGEHIHTLADSCARMVLPVSKAEFSVDTDFGVKEAALEAAGPLFAAGFELWRALRALRILAEEGGGAGGGGAERGEELVRVHKLVHPRARLQLRQRVAREAAHALGAKDEREQARIRQEAALRAARVEGASDRLCRGVLGAQRRVERQRALQQVGARDEHAAHREALAQEGQQAVLEGLLRRADALPAAPLGDLPRVADRLRRRGRVDTLHRRQGAEGLRQVLVKAAGLHEGACGGARGCLCGDALAVRVVIHAVRVVIHLGRGGRRERAR